MNDAVPNQNTCALGDDGADPESLRLVRVESVCGDGPGASGHAPAADSGDEEARLALLGLILEWGHHRAVAGTGEAVRAAWADINEALKYWRPK